MLTPKSRTAIRQLFGVQQNTTIPVIIIPGSKNTPKISGESWGYFTKGGTPIRYPNAYAKKGRSNMVYQYSTKKIEVGEIWVKKFKGIK